MKSLSLFRAPRQHRSGDDAFSPAFAEALTPYFSPVTLADIWPDWHHTALNTFPLSCVPFRHRIYNRTIMYAIARNAVRRLAANGVVCVRGEMWMGDATAALERQIAQRNAYVYNYIDNWFALPALAARAKARCALADAIVVPTHRLQEICEELFPGKTTIAIEEPVDSGRFGPAVAEKAKVPTLVWAGGPFSQSELVDMRDILAAVYRACPFQLVVLSGYKEPGLPLTIPWKWFPYSPANEQEIIPKAWAGFCWLGDDAYASAKGCYKTKTYMAAGTAPVVTDVGHARQVLNAAGAGFLIPDNNAQLWIDALVHLLSSREAAVLEGGRARAFARDAFAYDRIAAEWAHAIHEVC